MESKIWVFINWGFLLVVILAAVWIAWGFPQGGDNNAGDLLVPSESCIDIESLEELKYEACYDASSKMIFLKASRGNANYQINKATVSFVDVASQYYDLENIPGAGENGAYKILAEKNPRSINIKLEVVRNFPGIICGSESFFIDDCPAGTGGVGVDISISPISGVGVEDFVEVEDFQDIGSDFIVMDLVDREKIWESTCSSNWECGEWEACEDGIRRRTCKDLKGCAIPTASPVSVQRCDGVCAEDWECEWSACEEGVSIPRCNDRNECGTFYDIPKELSCQERGKCSPNVVCGGWTDCEVDYDFMDLVGSDSIAQLSGSRARLCVDKNGCVSTQKEEEVCSVGVDIYTERFERCGEEYIRVYSALDDSTLAILGEESEDDSLNIYFDDQDGVYCDYCFDGVMNGDEKGVDCGGSCRECVVAVPRERHWWDFLF